VGSLERRLKNLEGRIGPVDGEADKRRHLQILEGFAQRFEQKLVWVSPRVESGEVSLEDMKRESIVFAAAVYVTLRFHGDPEADSAQDILEEKMANMERRFPEAATSNRVTRRLIEFYLEKLPRAGEDAS
jgi:hypothetical protein